MAPLLSIQFFKKKKALLELSLKGKIQGVLHTGPWNTPQYTTLPRAIKKSFW